MKDYQHNSPLRIGTEPLVFWLKPGGNQYLFAKIDPSLTDTEVIAETVNYIQSVCNQFSPEKPLNAQLLSEFLQQNERNLETSNQLIMISTILMIFVACLGLFGLSAFVNARKTKEIGVRKVLGASSSGVVLLLSKEFCKWVLLANIIAWPLAYYTMTKWLEDFAFRVEIELWIFFLSGAFAIIVALLTVSYQAIKAARANPVESLKYE
jgi:putative ABC transport system permease protein